MADASQSETGWKRMRRRVRGWFHAETPKGALVRDLAVGAGAVVLVMALIWGYTGQPFPQQAPLVVVESGSMMHGPNRGGLFGSPTGWGDPAFGRIGTIDPGDLVFVKDVDSLDDVETAFAAGKRGGYGGHGDVIVFRAKGEDSTPIIHRAMLRVDVAVEGCQTGGGCIYRVPEACDSGFGSYVRQIQGVTVTQLCSGTSQAFSLQLERDGLQLRLNDFPCQGSCGSFYSSLLTRGDNNPVDDQSEPGGYCIEGPSTCNSHPVRAEWIIGKARGEVPWFGLIKLALYGNERYQTNSDPTDSSHWNVIRASAPWDLWTCLFLTLGLFVAAPFAWDRLHNWVSRRREARGE